jgi:Ca2+-binding protein (EF-Hand superfamily)
MLSYETKNRIADFLLSMSDGERQVEVLRQVLCEQKDFEPYAAFKRIDRDRKGYIDAMDVAKFLSDNGIYHTEMHCGAFIRRYDLDKDEKLTYHEFLHAVLSRDNSELRSAAVQRPNYTVGPNETLPYEVEYALSKVIDKEITFYLNLDYQKINLIKRYDFNALDAFGAIDKFSTGRLDYENIRDFFRGQAMDPSDEDVIAILRRFDKDEDGTINFAEFSEALELSDKTLKGTVDRPTESYGKPQTYSPAKIGSRKASPSRTVTKQVRFSREASPDFRRTGPLDRPSSPIRRITSPIKQYSPVKSNNTSLVRSPSTTLRESIISPAKDAERDRLGSRLGSSPFKSTHYSSGIKTVERRSSPLKFSEINTTAKRNNASPARARIEDEYYQDKLKKSFEKPSNSTLTESFLTSKKDSSYASPNQTVKKDVRKALRYEENSEIEALIHTLKQFVLLDKDLEVAKQDLALRPDFNILDFFRTFDEEDSGALGSAEVEAGMRRYGIYPNREELYLFVRRFDKDNDGKLRFSDFAEMVTPKQQEYAALLNNRAPSKSAKVETISEVKRVFLW